MGFRLFGLWAAVLTLTSTASFAQTLTGRIPHSATGQLKIISPGTVVVQGGPGDEIGYALQIQEGKRAGLNLLRVDRQGRGILLSVTAVADNRYELHVTVPRAFGPVAVEAVGGDVSVFDLDAPVQIRSGGGRLTVDRLASSLQVESWGGEARLGHIGGDVRVRAGGGGIELQSAKGEAWLETGGGDITVRRVSGALRAATGAGNIVADEVGGKAEVQTAGGKIEVGQAGGGVAAESAGGAIVVGPTTAVECRSMGGAIRLRDSGNLQAVTGMGTITADLPATRKWLGGKLRSEQGDIIVSIPSKLSVTVVVHSAAAWNRRKIVSDFGAVHNDGRASGPRAAVTGRLSLNGGGPVLEIEALQGAVYLRRQQQ